MKASLTHVRFLEITKVGRVLERAVADLSNTYDNFSGTQLGAEIFEFKVDPLLLFEEIIYYAFILRQEFLKRTVFFPKKAICSS